MSLSSYSNNGNKNAIFLRSLEESDAERVWRWHNSEQLYGTLGGNFRFISLSTDTNWLRGKAAYSPTEANLAICLSESQSHIGNAYLRDIDWINRHAEFHLFIGEPTHRGLGLGELATRMVVNHAFTDLNLLRLYLFVLASNLRAIRTYSKCGFRQEGRLKHHVFKNGQYEDVEVMGLLRG